VIGPSQRPLLDNKQRSHEIDIHAPSGIRTRHPSKRAAATFMCGRHQVRISWLRRSVISSVYCGQYPCTPEPSRVNPLLSDLTGGKIGSEKPLSRLFGIRFLAYRCTLRNLNNWNRQCMCKKTVYLIKNKEKKPKTHFKAYICVVSSHNLTKFNLYHVSISRPRLAYVSAACYVVL